MLLNRVRKDVLDIDSIYLTREDLDKIMAADLSKFGIGHEHPGEKKAWIEKQELTDKNDYFKESASFGLFSASFCEI